MFLGNVNKKCLFRGIVAGEQAVGDMVAGLILSAALQRLRPSFVLALFLRGCKQSNLSSVCFRLQSYAYFAYKQIDFCFFSYE